MNEFEIWMLAGIGAFALAAIVVAALQVWRVRKEKQALRSELGKWEGEGGNVPQVPTPHPVVRPETSVPDRR